MEWLSVLKNVAPTVATALGTPLLGAAVSALGSIFGMSDPTQEKLKDFIEKGQLSGEMIVKLKELELKYKDDEAERGFKYEELVFKDVDSARKMQIATQSKWPGILSAVTTTAVVLVIAARMFGANLPDDPTTTQLIGSLTTAWGMTISYWFGTTRGSGEKTALLAKAPAIRD